ncbi:F-box protein [Legionella sp. PC997]
MFQKLPNELKLQIYSFFNAQTLNKVSLVSKEARNLISMNN